ncbi:hypothetical protein ACH5RR_032059 [Cinchona calisaya]|uniref:Uncharacterized protein n=1 Tax=Cinchona calisaya TaxID=153742 RepID=A0ABD2YK33_9GENT
MAFETPVKEFIANTYNLFGHVSHVRQRPIPFGKDIINTHYGLPDMVEKSEYARFLKGNIDYDEGDEQTNQGELWDPSEDIRANYSVYASETKTGVRTILSYHSQVLNVIYQNMGILANRMNEI